MGVSLTLYNHPKRYNSTARPTSPGRTVEVTLKQETSLNAPIFYLSGSQPTENYASFNGAYYFVEDITVIRADLWQIDCVLDVLATAKDEILGSVAYVEYCTGGYSDLPDPRLALRTGATTFADVADIGFTDAGHYALAATGETGVNIWEIDLYSKLQQVLANVSGWADNLVVGAADYETAVKVGFSQLISAGSAVECIRSCRWMPFGVSGGVGGAITLGRYNTGVMAGSVNPTQPFRKGSASITLGFTRSGYLRTPPFTEVVLYLPFVGVINISSALWANADAVRIDYSMDYRTGAVAYKVFIGGKAFGCYGADTGVDIPVGVSNTQPLNLITGITAAAVSASYGNIAGVVGGALGAFTPTPSSVGGISGGAGCGLSKLIACEVREHPVSGQPGNMNAVLGNPMFRAFELSGISGYVKTRGAAIVTALRGSDKDRLNNMLDSGIFIE